MFMGLKSLKSLKHLKRRNAVVRSSALTFRLAQHHAQPEEQAQQNELDAGHDEKAIKLILADQKVQADDEGQRQADQQHPAKKGQENQFEKDPEPAFFRKMRATPALIAAGSAARSPHRLCGSAFTAIT